MRVLLDTHTFLWFCQDDPSLSAPARQLIEDPANQCFLSIATCWEVAIKVGLKKLALGEPSADYFRNAIPSAGVVLLPISLDHATHVETLPLHHRDPFDRMLIAQSVLESMPLVSVDVAFDPYGITRLW